MDGGALFGILVAIVSVVVVVVATVVTVVLTVASVALPFWILWKVLEGSRKNQQMLMETGLSAPAKILGIAETGTYINHQPMLRLSLEVAPAEGAPFQVDVNRVCSIVEIPRLQPGAIVEIRYEAAKPSNAILVGL